MECSWFRAEDSLFGSTPPKEMNYKVGTSKRLLVDAQSTGYENCCQAMNEEELVVSIFYDVNSLSYFLEKQWQQETVALQRVSQHLF